MIRAWDTLPVHDERIPSGMYLAADCSLDIGAVRSSFWQELRAGLHCWDDDAPSDVLVISSGRSKPPSSVVWGPQGMGFV